MHIYNVAASKRIVHHLFTSSSSIIICIAFAANFVVVALEVFYLLLYVNVCVPVTLCWAPLFLSIVSLRLYYLKFEFDFFNMDQEEPNCCFIIAIVRNCSNSTSSCEREFHCICCGSASCCRCLRDCHSLLCVSFCLVSFVDGDSMLLNLISKKGCFF